MKSSQISLRTVYTVSFGVLSVLALVYAATRTQLAITLTLLAAMLAVALHHVVALLVRRGLPHWLAVIVVGLGIGAVGTAFGIFVVAPAVSQAQKLAADIPKLIEQVRQTHVYQEIEQRLGEGDVAGRIAQEAPSVVLVALGAVVNLVGAGVTIGLLAIFMLVFGGRVIQRALEEFTPDGRERLERILGNIYRALGSYVAGIMLIAGLNMIFTATFLGILGMPFFLPHAIVSGIASMVPYAGQILVAVVVSTLAFATMGGWPAVACVIYFIGYGQVEGNVLGPLVFRRALHINPLIIMLAILFLGEMSGVIGAFLAIPLVATTQIVITEILNARRHATFGPVTPDATPPRSAIVE